MIHEGVHSDYGFQDSEWSEKEDDFEINTQYSRRLMMVNQICDLSLEPRHSEEETAFGSKEVVTGRVRLPPAEGFCRMFDHYLAEVKGERGTKRNRSEPRLPLEVGQVPMRNKPSAKAIEIEGQPWPNVACIANSTLLSDFSFKTAPRASLEQDRLRKWEASAREELSLSSYNTWFLKASRVSIEDIQDQLVKKGEKLDKDNEKEKEFLGSIWRQLENVRELVDSAGIGTKKVAENTVSDIDCLILARRDSWLKKLLEEKSITKQELWDLRHTDLNERALFSQIDLDIIHEKSQKRVSDTLTKRMLENLASKQSNRGAKQSFRGGPSGRGSGSFSGTNRGGAGSFGSGRSRGRGRGGRGRRPNPFDADQSKKSGDPITGSGRDK